MTPAIIHTTIPALRHHPGFTQAKAGDARAALHLVTALMKPAAVVQLRHLALKATICPVLAIERTGVNMLPLAYAHALAHHTGFAVNTQVLQTNRTHHTGADALHRLLNPPTFSGPIKPGESYVVADDVVTTGSTVQALRLYIESRGAHVVAFTALAASHSPVAGSSLTIDIQEATLDALNQKHGAREMQQLLHEARIANSTRELSESQARYILSYSSLSNLRDTIIARDHSCGAHHPQQAASAQLMLSFA